MLPIIMLEGGTVAAWIAWIFMLVKFDPNSGGWIAHLLFYAALGLALQGTLTLAGFFWRRRSHGMIASRAQIGMILRQALLVNAFVLACLILAARNLLRVWSVLPLAVLTLVLEAFFISLSRRGRIASSRIS